MNPSRPPHPFPLDQWSTVQAQAWRDACLCMLDAVGAVSRLNLQTAKVLLEESSDLVDDWLKAEPSYRLRMPLDQIEPSRRKAQAYAGHVQRIVEESGMEVARVLDKQVDVSGRQLREAIEAMTADGPVGFQSLVSLNSPHSEDTNASGDGSPRSRA